MALLNTSLSRGTIVSALTLSFNTSFWLTHLGKHATSNNPDEDPAFDPHYFERNIGQGNVSNVSSTIANSHL